MNIVKLLVSKVCPRDTKRWLFLKKIKNILCHPLLSLSRIFKSKKIDSDYHFCSLGVNCLPKTALTFGGLQKSKSDGELTCPFDLCVTFLPQVIELISNNFYEYCNHIQFDKNKNIYCNTKYNIYYNHDTDCPNSPDGLNKIKNRYTNRINNFFSLLNSKTTLFFVVNLPTNISDIKKLYKILKKKHKNTFLICFDINCSLNLDKFISNDIKIIQRRHEFENLDFWWTKSNADLFKKLIIDLNNEVYNFLELKHFKPNTSKEEIPKRCALWNPTVDA